MAIRITGMYSGLDTESIISELVSAQSVKKNSMVKAQTKLSWKQDAWKALNTKLYNFYTNVLSDMRFAGSYQKKTTSVSNSNIVSVITGSNAVNGVQNLKVDELAKAGYLTGGKLDGDYKSSTTLGELGIADGSSFSVEINGKSTEIEVNADTTISGLVKQLQSAGLNANFDEKNQRFFVSSKNTGAANNFNLVGSNADGMNALDALGMLTLSAKEKEAYSTWASYADAENAGKRQAAYDAEVAKRAEAYKAANDSLAKSNESLQEKIDANQEKINANQEKVNEYTTQMDDVTLTDGDREAIQKKIDELRKKNTELQEQNDESQAKIDGNKTTITANEGYFTVNEDDGTITATDALKDDVEDYFQTKIELAQQVKAGDFDPEEDSPSDSATKTEGQDAEIYLNDAYFTSSTNTFEINGLTMTMQAKGEATLSTGEDTDGIYDMVKNFITEYNKLINEMSALYNADSSKGYDPLLSEEKDAMSDSEIEEWEKKIKDSLLRRDSTLGTISDAMKMIMLKGATVNGKTMYLSDFGINTLGYFNAADNEKSAYHIDGDPDDPNTKNEADILKAMIAADPDTVTSFFTQLSKNLYEDMTDKMAGTSLSSVLTFYNDKQMKEEYEAYKDKIAKEETKLNDMMDKWYKKFSKMETAMSRLESKNSALSSMLGG